VRQSRTSLEPPPIIQGANHWEHLGGKAWQLEAVQTDFKRPV
jgi:hypothetical protein